MVAAAEWGRGKKGDGKGWVEVVSGGKGSLRSPPSPHSVSIQYLATP